MPGHFTFFSEEVGHGIAHFSESEARHMIQVLRFGLGDTIACTDGKGCRYEVEIAAVSKKGVDATITKTEAIERPQFTLVVGVLKSTDRMEWILEKTVELGVKRVVFIACDTSERSKIFLDKLMKTCIAALKQSHGSWLPELEYMTFKEALKVYGGGAFIAHCSGNLPKSAKELRPDSTVFIGPEGDFSESEVRMAQERGLQEMHLGARILRTETAAVAVCVAANLCG